MGALEVVELHVLYQGVRVVGVDDRTAVAGDAGNVYEVVEALEERYVDDVTCGLLCSRLGRGVDGSGLSDGVITSK